MSLTSVRLGELALHALSFRDMTRDDWIGFFETRAEVEAMFTDENCNIYDKINDGDVEKEAEIALNIALSQFDGTFVEPSVEKSSVGDNTVGVQHTQQVQSEQVVHLPVVAAITVLTTDKGCFFHFESWKLKLMNIYKYIDDFDNTFGNACLEANVDPTLDFISEVKKKAIAGKLKKCAKEYIDNLTDNL